MITDYEIAIEIAVIGIVAINFFRIKCLNMEKYIGNVLLQSIIVAFRYLKELKQYWLRVGNSCSTPLRNSYIMQKLNVKSVVSKRRIYMINQRNFDTLALWKERRADYNNEKSFNNGSGRLHRQACCKRISGS